MYILNGTWGYSMRNPYTRGGRFTKSLPQGECEFQIGQLNEHAILFETLTPFVLHVW